MKNYTDHFDSGYTHLFTGQCVTKDHPLVEALGGVDELNSLLGMALSHVTDVEIRGIIQGIQRDLLTIGADLATPLKRQKTLDPTMSMVVRSKEMTEREVAHMESDQRTGLGFCSVR